MKIAIVGADERKWNKEQKKRAKHKIQEIFCKYGIPHWASNKEFIHHWDWSKITLISGGCHRRGVDIWAEEIANKLGIKKEIYPAEVHQWEDKEVFDKDWDCGATALVHHQRGYRSRNIEIAEACDILFDIEPKGRTHGGGIWTMDYAKKLGKEVYQIVIE